MPLQQKQQKPKPRPVGRPKLHKLAKSSIVPVRFSAENRRKVEAAARAKKLSVSEWIRSTLEANLNG